jgi:hypothetical protein
MVNDFNLTGRLSRKEITWKMWTYYLLIYLLTYLLTYSLIHSLTPRCRIFFEKLIVTFFFLTGFYSPYRTLDFLNGLLDP